MTALKRWYCVLAVLGLAVLPGWCPAQTTDIEKALKDAEKAQREAQKAAEKALQDAQIRLRYWGIGAAMNRLGTNLESPSAAVTNQLDLPAGQGQVVKSVQANSAAAKAGIQANDILLEIDGKPVSSNMGEFEKALGALKPETAVDAVVLRKGQKTTIKGLMVPKAEQQPQFGQFQLQPGAGFEVGRAMPVPQVPGQIVPAEVQGQLKLTAEQKEKLAKLQKDTEAKVMELLTDEQKKQLEELKKNQGRRLAPQLLPGQPVLPNPDDLRKRGEELKKQAEELKKQLEKKPENNPQGQNQRQPQAQVDAEKALKDAVIQLRAVTRGAGANRLGATLETPSDAVATQLNLPQGQGLVLKNVPANSPAAKAGMQPNDILLELGGKSITRNPAEFDKAVEQIKPDAPVDAVVLRKGEKTTVKGVALAAAAPAREAHGTPDRRAEEAARRTQEESIASSVEDPH
jgi:C-terminal processing protease CtpA/Prc